MTNVIDLVDLFVAHRDDAAHYGEGLSNHLPMALAALAEMGASPERARRFAARYVSSHGLGRMNDDQRARRDEALARIRADGLTPTVATTLAIFANSIGADAFHAAIRLAYAVRSKVDDETAAALAYARACHFPIEGPVSPILVDAATALALLAEVRVEAGTRGLIATRAARVGANPAFAPLAAVTPPLAAIDDLATAAAAAFARNGNFTSLHVMTATHAFRDLSAWFDDGGASAMPPFWRAYAATALVAGDLPALERDELETLRAQAPARWEPLLAAAVESDDDHVVKATYTAWCLERAIGDRVFRTAAARYLAARTTDREK